MSRRKLRTIKKLSTFCVYLCASPTTWLTKNPNLVYTSASCGRTRRGNERCLAGQSTAQFHTHPHTHMYMNCGLGRTCQPANCPFYSISIFSAFILFYCSPFFHLFSISVARFIHPFIELAEEPIQHLPLYFNIYSLFVLFTPYSPVLISHCFAVCFVYLNFLYLFSVRLYLLRPFH